MAWVDDRPQLILLEYSIGQTVFNISEIQGKDGHFEIGTKLHVVGIHKNQTYIVSDDNGNIVDCVTREMLLSKEGTSENIIFGIVIGLMLLSIVSFIIYVLMLFRSFVAL